MRARIEEKLAAALEIRSLELVDETYMHNVPPDSESHWKLLVVSSEFEGQRAVQRHRRVHAALADELRGRIHALSLVTLTPTEWSARGSSALSESPPCLGGSKHDH